MGFATTNSCTAVSNSYMMLLYNIVYMNCPQQICTGAAGEYGGLLKARCTAKANANQVFQGLACKLIGY